MIVIIFRWFLEAPRPEPLLRRCFRARFQRWCVSGEGDERSAVSKGASVG
jgi:hypothetical protein